MKTQNSINKLDFRKESIVELNDHDLQDVNGGSSTICFSAGWMVSRIATAIYNHYND